VEGADHGEHKFMREREALDTAGADGCGNCGEEFAEASVLSGLQAGKLSRERCNSMRRKI